MNTKDHANLIEIPMPRVAGFDLAKEMSERPYAVLGLGVLAGYVLGGGLFSRLTGRFLATGLRVVALPLATRAAVTLVQSAWQPPSSGAAEDAMAKGGPRL